MLPNAGLPLDHALLLAQRLAGHFQADLKVEAVVLSGLRTSWVVNSGAGDIEYNISKLYNFSVIFSLVAVF